MFVDPMRPQLCFECSPYTRQANLICACGIPTVGQFQEQRHMKGSCRMACAAVGLSLLACALPSVAQQANPEAVSSQQPTQPATTPAAAPVRLTLQDALDLARKNSVQ